MNFKQMERLIFLFFLFFFLKDCNTSKLLNTAARHGPTGTCAEKKQIKNKSDDGTIKKVHMYKCMQEPLKYSEVNTGLL